MMSCVACVSVHVCVLRKYYNIKLNNYMNRLNERWYLWLH